LSHSNLIILDEVLKQEKQKVSADSDEGEFFELFVFEQMLKNLDLSYDKLESGRTDGPNDGGVDGFYVFINGDLVDEVVNKEDYLKHPTIDVFVFQCTRSESFTEVPIDKFIATSNDIFDLERKIETIQSQYNDQLIGQVALFRDSFLSLASLHPNLRITFIYANKGDTNAINSNLKHRKESLLETVQSLISGSSVDFKFIGASELLIQSRIEKTYTLNLNFIENIMKPSGKFSNYIILSSLVDYFKFVSDEGQNLRKYIFESNVRDFQGKVEVNKEISKTLEGDEALDFWWLNNGITILASEPTIAGNTIHLDNVQIINGLQTTTCIYNYFKAKLLASSEPATKDTNRSILIKIININDPVARDKIIRATNLQTAVPLASFKAMDQIQKNIETYFQTQNWYYDRRRNFYKNIGKPSDKIVSIELMAQSIMAMIFRKPQVARARPTSIVRDQYDKVFDEHFSPSLYLFCAQLIKLIEKYLRKNIDDFTRQEKTNLKFHIAMITLMLATKKKSYSSDDISKLQIKDISDGLLYEATSLTIHLARKYITSQNTSLEKLTKSEPFVEHITMTI